ncbi:MAG: hypothetical protein SGI71_00985 [Verrucomicrobiota bacterium]|nr:hypothetical protein [Verrucomicrobiota bacterium]
MLTSFEWMLPDLKNAFSGFELCREPREDIFRHYKSADLEVSSDGWIAKSGCCNIRYTRFHSPKIDIVTAMIYPIGSPDKIPVFAAEWVCLGSRIQPVVWDVEPLDPELSERTGAVFTPFRMDLGVSFKQLDEQPNWFKEICTPWNLFSACGESELPRLRAFFQKTLAVYVEQFIVPFQKSDTPNCEHKTVLNYKKHHFVHSPGRKLLSVRFPPEYSETFLRDYHFGPARIADALL